MHFVSESIKPDPATFATGRMASGEPGLPRCFTWRGKPFEVEAVLRTWRETSPCRHGSGEQYVRKHCYEVRLTTGAVAQIYFERQARATSQAKKRWWLLSLTEAPPAAPPASGSVP
jgi:phosphoribosylglycinamide formyltransferase-1